MSLPVVRQRYMMYTVRSHRTRVGFAVSRLELPKSDIFDRIGVKEAGRG